MCGDRRVHSAILPRAGRRRNNRGGLEKVGLDCQRRWHGTTKYFMICANEDGVQCNVYRPLTLSKWRFRALNGYSTSKKRSEARGLDCADSSTVRHTRTTTLTGTCRRLILTTNIGFVTTVMPFPQGKITDRCMVKLPTD